MKIRSIKWCNIWGCHREENCWQNYPEHRDIFLENHRDGEHPPEEEAQTEEDKSMIVKDAEGLDVREARSGNKLQTPGPWRNREEGGRENYMQAIISTEVHRTDNL